jgi:hypothetical protein
LCLIQVLMYDSCCNRRNFALFLFTWRRGRRWRRWRRRIQMIRVFFVFLEDIVQEFLLFFLFITVQKSSRKFFAHSLYNSLTNTVSEWILGTTRCSTILIALHVAKFFLLLCLWWTSLLNANFLTTEILLIKTKVTITFFTDLKFPTVNTTKLTLVMNQILPNWSHRKFARTLQTQTKYTLLSGR